MQCPDLAGKVVLVTGAGTGIGRATATMFAAQGSNIVGLGRRMPVLQEAMAEIVAHGGEAIAVQADVSDEAQVQGAVSAALERYGRIDVLVNNAGLSAAGIRMIDMDLESWNRVLGTVLTGTMLCSKHVARHMVECRSGVIVNVSSLAGKLPRFASGAYSVAKAGLDHLTRVLALELAKDGVRVNAVSPGTTRTERLEAGLARTGQSWEKRVSGNLEIFRSPIPLSRVSEPEEQASVILFLASDASSFMTGQIVWVDGGAGII
jgi:3-oxoacyl-[acyl-carrier protein] reductase